MASDPVPGIDPQKISNKVSEETKKAESVNNGFTINDPVTNESINVTSTSKPDVTPKFFEEVADDRNVDDKSLDTKKIDTVEADDLEELTNPGAEHFKRLRTSHSELKRTAAQLKEERDTLAEKVKKYDTGEVVPEVLLKKDEEITRLSKYEKLVNLKGSKEYREKFAEPIQEARNKLKEKFAEYNVPEEALENVVNSAFNTKTGRDLNLFLQDHFGNDELGALEAKTIITKAREIQKAAYEAEKEPAKMMETLQQESDAVMQVRENNRKQKIVGSAKSSWVESIEEIRTEGQLVELIHKEDDPEFNANYPDRLLPQAAKEYGKIITELGNLGATDLPKPLAKALAKMVLLAHSTGVAIQTRNRAIEGIEELTHNMTRQHTMMRPPIGGGVSRGGNGGAVPAKTVTPEQDARAILNSVLAKK